MSGNPPTKGLERASRCDWFTRSLANMINLPRAGRFSSATEVEKMGQLFDDIRRLVAENRYLIGIHASERLEKRGIMDWQAVVGLEDGQLLAERFDDDEDPVVEVRESLSDGTDVKAVGVHLKMDGVAKLVTVHFFDRR